MPCAPTLHRWANESPATTLCRRTQVVSWPRSYIPQYGRILWPIYEFFATLSTQFNRVGPYYSCSMQSHCAVTFPSVGSFGLISGALRDE